MNETRVCSKCYIAKPLHEFYKGTSNTSGTHSWCKVCHSAYHKQWRASKRTRPGRRKGCTTWVCARCKVEKPLHQFQGAGYCKECSRAYNSEYRIRAKSLALLRKVEPVGHLIKDRLEEDISCDLILYGEQLSSELGDYIHSRVTTPMPRMPVFYELCTWLRAMRAMQ